jgi:hypothetical protein
VAILKHVDGCENAKIGSNKLWDTAIHAGITFFTQRQAMGKK